MSLQSQAILPIPEATERVAHALFPSGNRYIELKDELSALYTNDRFFALYLADKQFAEQSWRIALVLLMQYMENYTDDEVVEAMRTRIDWKYVLGLDLADPGLDLSVLSAFRQRLAAKGLEEQMLDALLQVCQEHGWLKEHKKQKREYIVDAQKVVKKYWMGQNAITALQGINLRINTGEVVAIMGPSGCGKTTLLNCLSGLDAIDEGTIKIVDRDLQDFSDNALTEFRARNMGFIFQTYNLLPVLTGVENVELPMLVSGVRPRDARQRALEVIEQVGVSPWAQHRPAEMSGGQRQRFTIARALSTKPAIVWADEPTGALDTNTGQEIIDLMLRLNSENQQTFVWVTHAPEVAAQAERLVKMRDGQIIEDAQVKRSNTVSDQPRANALREIMLAGKG